MKSLNRYPSSERANSKRINKSLIVVCLVFCCLVCINVHADILNYYDESTEISLIIGETQPLKVSNPRQVKIGNPDLLDVVGAGQRELLLSGLEEGETILTVVDDFGKRTYSVKIFQEDLEKLKERVDILLSAAGFDQLTTQIGDRERKVFVLGRLPISKKESLEGKLDLVKDKIVNLVEHVEEIPTVEIDVEILEIAKTDLDNLGFTWTSSVSFSEPSLDNFPEEILNPKKTLQILKSWRTTQLAATLNILKNDNKVRTLSRPKLVCLSGKEAKLLVGGERPIITGSTTTSGSGSSTTDYEIEMKEYGITLNVKPTVKENDEINVSLSVEITDVDTTNQLTLSSTISTPGFTERSAQTELSVMSGQTVFLAGLIKSVDSDLRTEVPFLGRLPIFGHLFRNKNLSQTDTEIVITLSPTIIRNQPIKDVPSETVVKVSTNKQSAVEAHPVELKETLLVREDDPVVKYSRLIQDIINSNIKYPKGLEGREIEGTVKLSLHLLPDGEVSGVIVMQSSGSELLNEAAENTVKRLTPFPVFPLDVKLKELWIDIPIIYKSDNTI